MRTIDNKVIMVLVKEDNNIDGILRPDIAREATDKFEIIEIGNEVIDAKIGDIVYLKKGRCWEYEVNGNTYYVTRITEIDIFD